MSRVGRRLTNAPYGRGDRAVSAGQLKGLVPGSPDPTGAGPGRRADPVIRHERACGAPVVEAATAPGGFSPGLAARIVCGDGRRWFVKAASGQVNPDTPRLHRQEARILGDLDPLIRSGRLPVPRLRATVEHGSWFALILEDIDGRHPALPWEDGQVGQVLDALDRLADVLTPAPITAPTIGQYLGTDFTGWRILARTPGDERLDP